MILRTSELTIITSGGQRFEMEFWSPDKAKRVYTWIMLRERIMIKKLGIGCGTPVAVSLDIHPAVLNQLDDLGCLTGYPVPF